MEIAVPEGNWVAAVPLDGRFPEFHRLGFRIGELNEDEIRAMDGAGEQEARESDSGPAHSYLAAQRIGLQLQQTALTVSATVLKSRRQNATEFRNAQLSVVSCKPLLGGAARYHETQWYLSTRRFSSSKQYDQRDGMIVTHE
jgi:hypothetical protein